MKAFTYVSWLDGYLGGGGGGQCWVSRTNFTTREAEDVKLFIYPWFSAMNGEGGNMYTTAKLGLSSIFQMINALFSF